MDLLHPTAVTSETSLHGEIGEHSAPHASCARKSLCLPHFREQLIVDIWGGWILLSCRHFSRSFCNSHLLDQLCCVKQSQVSFREGASQPDRAVIFQKNKNTSYWSFSHHHLQNEPSREAAPGSRASVQQTTVEQTLQCTIVFFPSIKVRLYWLLLTLKTPGVLYQAAKLLLQVSTFKL